MGMGMLEKLLDPAESSAKVLQNLVRRSDPAEERIMTRGHLAINLGVPPGI